MGSDLSKISPSIIILPEVGFNNPTSILANVDFPQPDSPTRPKVSPGFIFKETALTAVTSNFDKLSAPLRAGNFLLSLSNSRDETIFQPALISSGKRHLTPLSCPIFVKSTAVK